MQYTVEELYTRKEDQTYDRKSARKDPKGLSNHIVAFANADGGTLVIGIEDNFEVTGIDDYQNNVNDILRVPFDYCKPSNGKENGELSGELNGDNGELNPNLLYLNKSELAVYHLIEKTQQNSRQEIADQLNISTRTVDRAIKSLIQKDLIIREGSKETGHWKIV